MILKNDCAWARLPKVRYGTLAFFGAIVCYGYYNDLWLRAGIRVITQKPEKAQIQRRLKKIFIA